MSHRELNILSGMTIIYTRELFKSFADLNSGAMCPTIQLLSLLLEKHSITGVV